MANRFWVGGSGNTNDTAHWSTTSGGSGGSSVPGSSDDVIIDNNSGATPVITINETNVWHSLTAGDSTKKSPQAVKNVTLAFTNTAIADLKQISAGITIYGNVQFTYAADTTHSFPTQIGTTDSLSGFRTIAAQTIKMYTDSWLPYLMHNGGSNVTLTVDNGSGDSAIATYNIGVLDLESSSSLNGCKITMPSNSNGCVMYAEYVKGGGLRSPNMNLNNAAKLQVSRNCNFHGTSVDIGVSNVSGSTIVLNGSYVQADFRASDLGALQIADNTACKLTITASFSTTNIILGNNTTLELITGVNFDIGGMTTGQNVRLFSSTAGTQATILANNLPLTVTGWSIRDIAFYKSSGVSQLLTVIGGVDGGNNTNVLFLQPRSNARTYRYEIYSAPPVADVPIWQNFQNEPVFLGTWNDVMSEPDIKNEINTAGASMVIRRAVDPENFGEATSTDAGTVGYKYHLEVTCFNDFEPAGEIIFKGFISQWTPNDEPGNRYVEITVLSYGSQLSQYLGTKDFSDVANLPFVLSNGDGAPLALPANTRKAAQSFTTPAGTQTITGISLAGWVWKGTNSVKIRIVADSGDAPNEASIVKQEVLSVPPLHDSSQFIDYFPMSFSLSGSTKYWLVVEAANDTFGTGEYSVEDSQLFTGGSSSNASNHAAYWDGAAWQKNNAWGIRQFAYFLGQGSTTVSFSAVDWNLALRTMLSDFISKGGQVNYNSVTTLGNPGINVNITFKAQTLVEVIQTFVDLAGAGYYWYVDPATNTLWVINSSGRTHNFNVGKNIKSIKLEKTMETVINALYLTGGDTGGGSNLFRLYVSPASIARYGYRTAQYNDNNLTNTSDADYIGTRYINQFKDPTYRAPVVIGDKYHIESIKPGDLFSVYNTDNSIIELQVSRVEYKPDQAGVDASTAPPQINATIEDLRMGLGQQYAEGNPTAPTIVEV